MTKSQRAALAAAQVVVAVAVAVVAAWLAGSGGVAADQAVKPLSLEARVQQLEDEATIRRLLDDYMGLLQSRDWDSYVKMFAKQGEIDIVEGVLRGRDAIRTRMDLASRRLVGAAAARGPQRQRADLLSDVRVQVTGDTATAKSRFTFLGEQEDGSFRVTGSGVYTDKWIREEGEWRIASRTVKWDLLAGASAPPPASTSAAPAAR